MCSVPVATRRTRIRDTYGDVRNQYIRLQDELAMIPVAAANPDVPRIPNTRQASAQMGLRRPAGQQASKRRPGNKEISPFAAAAPHFARTRALLPDL